MNLLCPSSPLAPGAPCLPSLGDVTGLEAASTSGRLARPASLAELRSALPAARAASGELVSERTGRRSPGRLRAPSAGDGPTGDGPTARPTSELTE